MIHFKILLATRPPLTFHPKHWTTPRTYTDKTQHVPQDKKRTVIITNGSFSRVHIPVYTVTLMDHLNSTLSFFFWRTQLTERLIRSETVRVIGGMCFITVTHFHTLHAVVTTICTFTPWLVNHSGDLCQQVIINIVYYKCLLHFLGRCALSCSFLQCCKCSKHFLNTLSSRYIQYCSKNIRHVFKFMKT